MSVLPHSASIWPFPKTDEWNVNVFNYLHNRNLQIWFSDLSHGCSSCINHDFNNIILLSLLIHVEYLRQCVGACQFGKVSSLCSVAHSSKVRRVHPLCSFVPPCFVHGLPSGLALYLIILILCNPSDIRTMKKMSFRSFQQVVVIVVNF